MHCKILLAATLAVSLSACNTLAPPRETPSAATPTTTPAESETDRQFAQISRDWLDQAMALAPVSATQIGKHRHDEQIDDLGPDGRAARRTLSQRILAQLDALPAAQLSRANQVDALILRNQIQSDLWSLDVSEDWAWDPQVYSGLAGGAIYNLMARDFAPVATRLRAATARMEKIPALLAQARANLVPAQVPRIHAETVARQNRGVLSLVDEMVLPVADALQGDERARLDAAIQTLRTAVDEHQTWLDEVLVPNAAGDFRIGAEHYDQKLRMALNSSLSRTEIRQRAEAELVRVRAEMYELARSVLGARGSQLALPETPTPEQQQAAIEAALELAYVEHPARNDVVEAARSTLAEATRFTREHDLVSIPDDPVKIILMPEFQRGVAVAYCDSPGPLDKGLETFYAVSPIPDDWSDAQAESFLREYNTRMIHLLSIHEAMPGHYLEGAFSARYPSVLRGVLRSGTFAEGWAVYTEAMMTDAGYLDGDPLFRLVRDKFYLRTVANAILDQGVHVDGWSREQAMDLMVRRTFQQEREAAGKWVRVQLTSAQLPTYFVGVQEHFDTRRAVEAAEGRDFDLKRYNDRVLSWGAPPVRFVRQLMLDQAIQ